MADQGKWFKLWCSADDDPDLANLSLEDFARWCKLGMYVKLHGESGSLMVKYPAIALQQKFRVSTCKDVLTIIARFPHVSTVSTETNLTVSFSNWLKYQGDFSTSRVRKFRQMKRSKRRGEEKRIIESSLRSDSSPGTAKGLKLEFAPEDVWIKTFLESQQLVEFRGIELMALLDAAWWERTAIACHGIDRSFLEAEFAKMGNWLGSHRGRRPTKRFVQSWLVKAGEPQ